MNNPDTMDTTQCREALENLQVDFPRGYRLAELRALLKQTQAQGHKSTDRKPAGA